MRTLLWVGQYLLDSEVENTVPDRAPGVFRRSADRIALLQVEQCFNLHNVVRPVLTKVLDHQAQAFGTCSREIFERDQVLLGLGVGVISFTIAIRGCARGRHLHHRQHHDKHVTDLGANKGLNSLLVE